MKANLKRTIKAVLTVLLFDIVITVPLVSLFLLAVILNNTNVPFYINLKVIWMSINSYATWIVYILFFVARVVLFFDEDDNVSLSIFTLVTAFLLFFALILQSWVNIDAMGTPTIVIGKSTYTIPGYTVKPYGTLNVTITQNTVNGIVKPLTLLFGSKVVNATATPDLWFMTVSNFASYSEVSNITNYLSYTEWVFIQTMQDGNSTAKLVIVKFSQLPQTLAWLKVLGFDPNQAVEAEHAFILSMPYNWTSVDGIFYMVYNNNTYATTVTGPYLVVLTVHNAVLPKDVVVQYMTNVSKVFNG
jgi:hypothetical protein